MTLDHDEQDQRFRAIGEYYEQEAVRCWEVTARNHMHHGYWDDADNGDPFEGPRRLTQIMIDMTPIAAGERFIDLGAGLGAPALMLARQRCCEIDGVNASIKQTETACRLASEAGLAESVRFTVQDATRLPFPDASFDGGWFLESIFHMGHATALAEARRVLKPGAILLIADFTNLPHTSQDFIDLQHNLLYAHHIMADEYPGLLTDAGFELLEQRDVTREVIVNSKAMNHRMMEAHQEDLMAVTDPEYLAFVAEVNDLFVANSGYVLIKARAV